MARDGEVLVARRDGEFYAELQQKFLVNNMRLTSLPILPLSLAVLDCHSSRCSRKKYRGVASTFS